MKFHSLNNVSIYQAEGQSPFLSNLSLLTVVAVFLTYLLWNLFALYLLGVWKITELNN